MIPTLPVGSDVWVVTEEAVLPAKFRAREGGTHVAVAFSTPQGSALAGPFHNDRVWRTEAGALVAFRERLLARKAALLDQAAALGDAASDVWARAQELLAIERGARK